MANNAPYLATPLLGSVAWLWVLNLNGHLLLLISQAHHLDLCKVVWEQVLHIDNLGESLKSSTVKL